MHFSIICAILGLLLLVFSLTMLIPIIFALYYNEATTDVFLLAFTLTSFVGAILWLPNKNTAYNLRTRDGFLITTLFWLVLGLFGALPLYISDAISLTITDAIFESLSGLTTTGATVISGLDDLPKSILYYRQQLQWLGGIGIIVIAIAILPMLGIGGIQLYRAEIPGPMKDSKIMPRVKSTAKTLFSIYLLITLCCGLSYWLAGMTPFDALCHSFSTVAIGGFSTHDASLGYFNNPYILIVAIIFMFIAGINFALHYFAFRYKSVKTYLKDSEFSFYSLVHFLSITIVILSFLFLYKLPIDFSSMAIESIFHVVSIATTTGFISNGFSHWPAFLPFFVFFLAFIGACAGSTGGGMKSIRILLMLKQGYGELIKLIHPQALVQVKVGTKSIDNEVISAVWSFFAFYIIAFFIMTLGVLASGVDFVTAFSAVGACINNLGPGLGEVINHYSSMPEFSKWILCVAMLIGRLEVFTVLVLLTPAFWRK